MIDIRTRKSRALLWLYENTKNILWKIIFMTFMAVGISYISMRFALVSKSLLDAATHKGDLKEPIISIAVLIFCQLLIQIVYTLLNLHTETKFKNTIQRKVFSKFLCKKWKDISSYHSGEILNRLNGDVNIVTSGVMTILPNLFSFLSGIVMGFYALCILDPQFALVFLIIGPFVMAVSKVYSSKMKPLHKKCQTSLGKIHSFIIEAIHNITVVKTFSAQKRMEQNVENLQKNYLGIVMKRGYISIFANILFFISLTIGYYFAVGWCAVKISRGIMTVGTFAAIIQLVGQVQSPFRELASTLPKIFTLTASCERIMELENLEDEEMRYSAEDTKDIYDSMKSISFENLSFSYDGEKILDRANCNIEKNSLVCITGVSGTGKSTLMKIMLGILTPDGGNALIKCEDKDYVIDASLRHLFSYVPQGNMILSGTVRDNISFMSSEIDEEKIIRVSKLACIYNVIKELPFGFDTILGEGGLGLSEGQIQRLAIARALYTEAPILLLDEATSALDEDTERKLLENIRSIDGFTCIIISHKDAALKISDRIIKISDGKIAESPENVD